MQNCLLGKLKYGRSSKNCNLVGPLLEKALIQLLFDKDYKASYETHGHQVLTSFTNSFFEFYEKNCENCKHSKERI